MAVGMVGDLKTVLIEIMDFIVGELVGGNYSGVDGDRVSKPHFPGLCSPAEIASCAVIGDEHENKGMSLPTENLVLVLGRAQ